MRNIFKHMIGVFAIMMAVYGLYHVKYKVQDLREEVASVEKELVTSRKSVQVMSAEWAYLSRPDRLAQLQKKHLLNEPVMAQQITQVASLPSMPADLGGVQLAARPAPSGLTTVSAVMINR